MKLSDLILRTQSVLPLFDPRFTTNITINAVSKTGDEVTVTAANHKLKVDDQGKFPQVIISGVKTNIPLTDITTVNGIATAKSTVDHDLSVGFPVNAQIASGEPAYNGVFKILDVPPFDTEAPLGPGFFSFTFKVSGTPPPSTGTLSTFHTIGFNGTQTVTDIIDADNFKYVLQDDRLTTGSGPNMLLMKNPRISGAATLDRATDSYTRQLPNELWGFFIFGGMETSSDRTVDNDSKNEKTKGEDFKLRLINDVTLFLYIPTHTDLSGRTAIDLAQELAKPIYKTLAGFIVDTEFTTEQQTMLMPSAHFLEDYNKAFLIYAFDFQVTQFMLGQGSDSDPDAFMADTGDIISDVNTRALRTFEAIVHNPFEEIVKDDVFEV